MVPTTPTMAARGIATRNRRTSRLWRIAARNTRAPSVRPVVTNPRGSYCPACDTSVWDAMVKWLNPRAGPPFKESGGPHGHLSEFAASLPINVALPRHAGAGLEAHARYP